MPITNNSRVLNYLPYAIGSYGSGPGSAALQVGNAVPVNVKLFDATPDSGFQGTFYKDTVTGKYTVAFAGTNDATDALSPDSRLATGNLLTSLGVGAWDPQMTKQPCRSTSALHSFVLDAFLAFTIVFVSFAMSVCVHAGQKKPASTLCTSTEKVIFSCPLRNGKTVSLCASSDLSMDKGTLQYRFGRLGSTPELKYPVMDSSPRDHFWLDFSQGGLWAQYDLNFLTNGFRYSISVQTNSAIPEDGASLTVFHDRHRVSDMECRFNEATNNMWQIENLGLPSFAHGR